MRIIVFLASVMAMATVALAGVYEWTDSQGGVHFTDNADKIPPIYRKKVREVDIQPVIQIKEEPAAAVTPTTENTPSSYGGHNETWWRSSYTTLREEMRSIQNNLPGKKDKLAELRRKRTIYSRARDRIAFNQMDGEIKRDEARVTNLQKKLADLDNEAARSGVPLVWRQ